MSAEPSTTAAAAVDRWRRRVDLCSWCGGEYVPTADGRRIHRMLQEHTPTPAPKDGAR